MYDINLEVIKDNIRSRVVDAIDYLKRKPNAEVDEVMKYLEPGIMNKSLITKQKVEALNDYQCNYLIKSRSGERRCKLKKSRAFLYCYHHAPLDQSSSEIKIAQSCSLSACISENFAYKNESDETIKSEDNILPLKPINSSLKLHSSEENCILKSYPQCSYRKGSGREKSRCKLERQESSAYCYKHAPGKVFGILSTESMLQNTIRNSEIERVLGKDINGEPAEKSETPNKLKLNSMQNSGTSAEKSKSKDSSEANSNNFTRKFMKNENLSKHVDPNSPSSTHLTTCSQSSKARYRDSEEIKLDKISYNCRVKDNVFVEDMHTTGISSMAKKINFRELNRK